MASITIARPDLFPDGTSVAAYPATVHGVPASGAPFGSATETEVAASGEVAFDALAASTSYVLYASSPDRYLRVNTSAAAVDGDGASLPAGGTTGQVLAKASNDDGDAEWVTGGDAPVDADGTTNGLIRLAGDLTGTAASPQIAANAVGASEIAANAVGSSELANDAVDTAAIQDNAVTAAKVAADVATQAELESHTGASTSVHGITDTSVLATDDDVSGAVSAHAADTTAVHGISDTSAIKGVVIDGGSGYGARPSGFTSVEFIGPDDPGVLAEDGDTWVPTEAP